MKVQSLSTWLLPGATGLLVAVGAACSNSNGAAATNPQTAAQVSSSIEKSGLRNTPIEVGGDKAFKTTGKTVEYALTAKETDWELLPGVTAKAVTYNGTVPGPLLRVTEGDTLKVVLKNELPEPTTIHWHGVHVPNAMDGVQGVTQAPVMPGETFIYQFAASHAGTFMYHSHSNTSAEQIDRGLYGVLIIDPQTAPAARFDREYIMALQGWMVDTGSNDAMTGMDGEPMDQNDTMQMMSMMANQQMQAAGAAGHGGMDYNFFTINGKSFPATEAMKVKKGDLVRFRLANPSQTIHPMHLHGQDFKVVAKDGEPVPTAAQQMMSTITLNPGETYDIIFVADNPGVWAFHCHDLHHSSNNGIEPGGLMTMVEYEDFQTTRSAMPGTAMPATPGAMPGMGH